MEPISPVECPYCGAELETLELPCHLCGQRVELEQWREVWSTATEWEAELACGWLRAHGIPALVLSQRDSTRMFTVGALALVRLLVPEPYAQRARQLLRERS
ncbi:MAG: DUF2007 domain-containing protein [Chlorobiota bacterium]|jgi:hypothetical protein|nr:DUF2007 domain-containing protein [Chlorobiota bacterium]